jgi:hypothetical protein
MGANLKFLPELSQLKTEYREIGHRGFVQIYEKNVAFIGSDDSVNFVTQILNKKQNNKHVLHRKSKI